MSDQSSVWLEIENSVNDISLRRSVVSLSNEFDPASSEQLNRAFTLAWKLYLDAYSNEAEKVLGLVGDINFNGNFNLWVWIESSLLLHAWILRDQNNIAKRLQIIERLKQPENFDFQDEIKNSVNRRARQRRLSGSLLADKNQQYSNSMVEELEERILHFTHKLFVYFLADQETKNELDIENKILYGWEIITHLAGQLKNDK